MRRKPEKKYTFTEVEDMFSALKREMFTRLREVSKSAEYLYSKKKKEKQHAEFRKGIEAAIHVIINSDLDGQLVNPDDEPYLEEDCD